MVPSLAQIHSRLSDTVEINKMRDGVGGVKLDAGTP
jgi:hypothetical protein